MLVVLQLFNIKTIIDIKLSRANQLLIPSDDHDGS